MSWISRLPRLWPTIGLPGIAEGRATYWVVDLENMPSIKRPLDGTLSWLTSSPTHRRSLERAGDDPIPIRAADAKGLAALAVPQPLPATFRGFVEQPDPRRHIRSATTCYLDLGQFRVDVGDGGSLIHFLSDQQWVVHWLLYVGADGSEAVIATPDPIGLEMSDAEPITSIEATISRASLALCSGSFEEFLYRYWAMNELFFQLAVDRVGAHDLPIELREYAARYPASASVHTLFT